MPRKLTLSDLDFSNDKNSPDWVLALREENARDSLEKKNREENRTREAEAKAAAIVQEYQSRGINLSDDKIAEIYDTVARTGQYVEPSAVPATPVLPSSEPAQDEGYWADRMNELRRAGTMAEEVGHGLLGSGQGTAASLLETGMKIAQGRSIYGLDPSPNPDAGVRGLANTLRAEQDANYQELSKFRDYADTLTGVDKKIALGIADAAQSAGSSLPSLFGGAFGLTAVNDVYAQTYRQAVQSGVHPADAERLALEQAAPELIGVIPAGKFGMSILKKLPVIGPRIEAMTKEAADGLIKKIASPNVRAATDIARTAVGEMAEENITGTVQDLANVFEAGKAKSKEVRDFASQQAPLDKEGKFSLEQFMNNRSRERWAAGFMAVPAGVVEARNSTKDYEAERKSLENDLTGSITSNLQGEVTRQNNEALKSNVEANQDKTLEEQRAATEQAKQQAFDQAEKDAAKQKELEQEAGFQTIQRPTPEQTSVVERTGRKGFADVVQRVDLPAEPAVSPADVAEQRAADERAKAAADKAEADRLERVRQGQLAEEVRKEREKLAKANEAETKRQKKAQEDALRKQRGDVRRQLIQQNPEASDLEIGQMLDERMKTMPAPVIPTDPVEKKAAAALKGIETTRKRVASTAETKRMNALARKNPDATPQELATLFNGKPATQTAPEAPQAPATPAATTPATPNPNASPEEQERDKALQAMGVSLGMSTKAEAEPNTPAEHTQEGFQPVARKIANALTKRMDEKGRALSTMILQGKVVIAPSAKYLGRQEGRAAEFDPETGKTYIYADQVDSKNIVPHLLEAASHEAGHAGTRNQRNERATLMRALLGKDGVSQAEGKIRLAARNGNKLAQNAVRLAEADTKTRNGDNQYEGEEVVSYFTGEAVANRDKPLGTVAGIATDIRTKARSFLRDKVGLDLDVNLNDLNTAAQGVLAETARTDVKPTGGRTLGMIIGPKAKNFNDTTLPKYKGAVDNLERTEIPDYKSEVWDDGKFLKSLVKHTQGNYVASTTTLGSIQEHPELYENYPELKKYKVTFPVMGAGADAKFDADHNTISVNRDLLELAATIPDAPSYRSNDIDPDAPRLTNKEFLRRILLHETQHAIQDIEGFVPGANPEAFIPTNARNRLQKVQDDFNNVVKNFDLGRAEQSLTPQVKGVWNNEVKAAGTISRDAKAQLFLSQKYFEDSTDRLIKAYGPRYLAAAEALQDARDTYDVARDKAYSTYLRDHGETEARNTEHRSRMTTEELAANPPEDTMIDAIGNVPVGETLDTRPLAKERKPAASSSLGMAARTPAQTRRFTSVMDFLVPERWAAESQSARVIATSLLANGKGLNKNILTAYEHAQASPAAEEAKANRSLGKYDDALQRLAVERNTTPEALNKKIMEELDAIDAANDSYDANLSAFKAAVGKYGEAGQHLLDLRNQVDALTLEMLKQRAKGPKPSPEEAKVLKTLAANMGRYSHRLYAAHQGKAGKVYAHSVLAAYRKGQKGKELTPRQKETFDMVERAVKTIIDDGLMIPDDDGLAEASNDRVSRLYRTWGDNTAHNPDEMRDQLAELRDSINTDKDRLQEQAEGILKELLNIAVAPTTSPIATYYRGAKQDRGILQERQRIPAEIRAVMGEVTDPGTRLLATVAKQAEFVARTKFLLEVQKFADPMDLQPPGSAGTPVVNSNHMSKLEGESYGPLEGWYASPNMQAMLGDVRETLATFEQTVAMSADAGGLVKATLNGALNKWIGLAALSKRLQIVGNLFLLPLNFLGSFGSLAVNGNIKPTTMARGLQDAVALIRYARNPSLGLGSADDAVRYGVTDSATVGELKGLPYQKIQAFANEMAGKKVNQMWAVAKRQGMAFTELYAMMDVWAKIANFHNEVSQLQSYYKKNNQTRTEEEIKREAADIVNSTNITYKRAAPIVKALERGAITNFGTYFYETFRSQLGNTRQGIKEMTVDAANASTPAAKAEKVWRGTKRLSGQAAFWTAASMITSYLSSIMFGNDDDEWDKRSIFPDYMQNQDLYTVGVDEHGNPIQFAVSRIDAYGPMTDIMRQVQAGGMSYDQAKEELLSLYVRPRMGPQLWKAGTTIFGDDRPTKDPLTKELMPNGYENILKATSALGVEDKTTRALANLVESVFVPGTLNAQRSTNPDIAGPVPAREGASDLEKALQGATAQAAMATRVMGATFVKADPARVASFAKMDYDNVISNARKDFAELFDDRPNVSDNTIVDAIQKANDAEYKEYNKLARIYRGMQATGMSQEQINKALKEAKITGDILKQIKSQEFSPTAVSKKSFDSLMQRELRSKTDDEKKEIKAKWKAAWERLEQAQESVK